jgi:hypothetical protein
MKRCSTSFDLWLQGFIIYYKFILLYQLYAWVTLKFIHFESIILEPTDSVVPPEYEVARQIQFQNCLHLQYILIEFWVLF